MFNLFSSIEVKEDDRHIVVSGLRHRAFELDVYRLYHTGKITDYMIEKAGYGKIRFLRFFAVEFAFLLTKIIKGKRMASDKRAVAQVRELMFEKTWLGLTQAENVKPPLDLSRLKDLDLTPKDYHSEFFEEFNRVVPRYHLRGMLLAGAPGSGKTYVSLAVSHCLHANKTIVICPINATDRVWKDNVRLRFNGTKKVWISTENVPITAAFDVYVFHYEALEQALLHAHFLRAPRSLLVLDESHNLNEVKALRTQLFLQLCEDIRPTYVLEASGTPIKALGSESIPLLRAIDPLFTAEVEKVFRGMYGANATRTLEVLNHRMGVVSFKIEKERLGLEKPESRVLRVKTPDSDKYTLESISKDVRDFIEQRISYYKSIEPDYTRAFFDLVKKANQHSPRKDSEFDHYLTQVEEIRRQAGRGAFGAIKDTMAWCTNFENSAILPVLSNEDKKVFRDVRSAYKYVYLKIQGEALGRVIGRARVDCHLSMAKFINYKEIAFSTTKKTLVFTSFVEVLEQVDLSLKKSGFMPAVVYGKTNKDLNSIIKQFEKDADLNPLVATYKSLGTAVPMTMADTMVLIDSPFRTYILEQTIARIWRLGADSQVTIYTALLDTGDVPNISTRSQDILAWSQDQVKKIMGIDAPFKLEDEDNFTVATESVEQLAELMLAPNRSMAQASEDYGIDFSGDLCVMRPGLGYEVYQEEEGGYFESDGKQYDLNHMWRALKNAPVEKIHVSKLTWVLEWVDGLDEARVERADLDAPLLVTLYKGHELTVDGIHRLAKAVKHGVKTLNFQRVSKKLMDEAEIKPAAEVHKEVWLRW